MHAVDMSTAVNNILDDWIGVICNWKSRYQ